MLGFLARLVVAGAVVAAMIVVTGQTAREEGGSDASERLALEARGAERLADGATLAAAEPSPRVVAAAADPDEGGGEIPVDGAVAEPPTQPQRRQGVAPAIRWDATTAADPLADGPRHVGGAPRETPPDAAKSRRSVLLRAAFAASGDWTTAPPSSPARAENSAVFGDPLLKDLARWRRLQDAKRPVWRDVAALYDAHPAWPLSRAAQGRAEAAIPEGAARAALLAFFERRPPVTARGARLYGEALIAAGRRDAGEALIRRAFLEQRMDGAEETLFRRRHARIVEAMIEARHDMLLSRQSLRAARRLADELSEGRQRLTAAVAALAGRRGGVDAKIAAVPEELRDHPALRYARMKWRYQKRRFDGAEAEMIRASAALALGAPAVWADERRYLSREAYEDGRYMTAYVIAAGHGLTQGVDFAELEWFAGWIALEFLGDRERAKPHFEALYHGVKSPISRARAAFWAGEATAEPGERAFWRRLAGAHPQTFYGQLALGRLGVDAQLLEAAPRPADEAVAAAAASEFLRAAALLYAAGRRADARRFLAAAAEQLSDPADLAALAAAAEAFGDPWGMIRIGQVAARDGVHFWGALYPAPARPVFTGRRVDAALLLAVARQESRFNVEASSSAGALGLMQLMPGTARMNARALGLPYSKSRLTAQPSYNLTLGDAHLRRVLTRFDEAAFLAVAAYNAGSGNVDKWIARFGDPRDSDVDALRWVESIPFSETRNYVQRVLEGAQIYRLRLRDGVGPITLHRDLSSDPFAAAGPTPVGAAQ